MSDKQPLTPEEISAIVDEFDPIDWVQIELLAKMPPAQRWLVGLRKTEVLRADLRIKLMEDFPELSLPEINMKVLRSFSPVRMRKSYTEPAYIEHLG